jgi:hypothetical protein
MIDVVTTSELEETKGFLRTTYERKVVKPNNVALSHLWNLSNKYGLSLEIAAFEKEDWTQNQLDKFMDKMDRRGGNPFNYAELYSDIEDFISELPYRTNLKGVVDLRERVARYGSWGIELDNL